MFARFLAPGWFELELDVFILLVGGIALVDVVILARDAYPLEDVPEIVARSSGSRRSISGRLSSSGSSAS